MKSLFWPVLVGLILVVSSMFHCSIYGQCEAIWWLDDLYHFIGGLVAAWVALVWIKKYLPPLRKVDVLIVGLAGVALLGVLWEFAEYFSTVFGPTYWPILAPHFNIGTIDDTMTDFVFDLFGGLLFLVFAKK